MIAALLALALTPSFCPPQPWALDIAIAPRLPFLVDVNGDGCADIVVVDPSENGFIEVSLNQNGQKAGRPFRALDQWRVGLETAIVGRFKGQDGVVAVGFFKDKSIQVAMAKADGMFTLQPVAMTLSTRFDHPYFLDRRDGDLILADRTGKAYRIDLSARQASPLRFPKGLRWAESDAPHWAMNDKGQLGTWTDAGTFKAIKGLTSKFPDGRPAVLGDRVSFDNKIATPNGHMEFLPNGKLFNTTDVRAWGDIDNDGDADLVVFRDGNEMHWGHSVQLYRAITPGETDYDHDGLTNDEEIALGTDPYNPDTDNDGLLDGWEVKGIRGLDLKAMGCSPLHVDVICYIAPFEGCEEDVVKKNMERSKRLYAEIRTTNLDGTTGFALHFIYQPFIKKAEQETPWWELRDKYLPANQRGVAHWMQITPWGGGQAGQLDDGGGCGGWKGAAFNPFVHEFGHQLGMDHNGFWGSNWCPIYTSLMSYTYGPAFEDDGEKIHFSNGDLCSYMIHETDLDETLPFPYEKVKFLEKGPYRYHLKPNGNTTLIDWNWNGIFGEKHIQADVNYGYSTSAGLRDNVDYCDSAPWLFTHKGKAYALYGQRADRGNGKDDPSVSPSRPGSLLLRALISPTKWKKPIVIEKDNLIGDPTGISFTGKISLVYATPSGIKLNWLDADGKPIGKTTIVDKNAALVPSLGVFEESLWLFLWNPADGSVTYTIFHRDGSKITTERLNALSQGPVSMTEDTYWHRMMIGLSQNQDAKRPNRWQVRGYRVYATQLKQETMEWVEGEKGAARGVGRCIVLYERNKNTPKEGRLIYFARGGEPKSVCSTSYGAMQIADKTVHGGWLVKMYYDEWSNSRSAPAAAWFNGDIIYAYRWFDAKPQGDNRLHVGYRGTGIELEPMSDHDDVTFFKTFGVRHSILYMGAP